MREQVRHEHGGVLIGPLQVIDVHNQRSSIANAPEQLTEGGEGALLKLLRIGDVLLRCSGDGIDTIKHRKQPREREHLAWHEVAGLLTRDLAQVAAQLIDDGIKRLVRHGLALVAATRQHHRVVVST